MFIYIKPANACNGCFYIIIILLFSVAYNFVRFFELRVDVSIWIITLKIKCLIMVAKFLIQHSSCFTQRSVDSVWFHLGNLFMSRRGCTNNNFVCQSTHSACTVAKIVHLKPPTQYRNFIRMISLCSYAFLILKHLSLIEQTSFCKAQNHQF